MSQLYCELYLPIFLMSLVHMPPKRDFKPKLAGNYMSKVNNRNVTSRCKICLKITIKIPEQRLALFWCLYC